MAAQNEPPKIPSFKATRKKEGKTGGGPLSSVSKTTGAKTGSGFRFPGFGGKGLPNLKVRGLPGGTSVVDRLRNLRKKDLMFIAAGLSVLCMAPVAEHFMMTPEETGQAGKLNEGFSQRGEVFPDGTTVYEGGTGGFSPGNLMGVGSDVITPLNVRDPSALVMGPGATRKPEATVAAAPPPKAPPRKTDWKDALQQSASRAAKKAVKKAKLPMPNVKLSGALRGLSSLSGAGSTSAKMGPGAPGKASGALSRAAGSNSLTRAQAAPGYRGAARRSGASGGGAEGMKAGAGRAGDIMNQGGSAADSLQTSANETIPMNGGNGPGGGHPSKDDARKSPGKPGSPGSKSLGESLEYMRKKMEMENAMKLKWKRKEWEEFGRQKMIEESVIKMAVDNILGKGIFEPIGKALGSAAGSMFEPGGGPTTYECTQDKNGVALAHPAAFPIGICSDGVHQCSAGTLQDKNGTIQFMGCSKTGGASETATVGPGNNMPTNPNNLNGAPGGNLAGRTENAARQHDDLTHVAGNVDNSLQSFKDACTATGFPKAGWDGCADVQAMRDELSKLKTETDKLVKASEKVKKSWENGKKMMTAMANEQKVLGGTDAELQKADAALKEAQAALKVKEGAKEPDFKVAKTKLEAAAASMEKAWGGEKGVPSAGKEVPEVNKNLKEGKQLAEEAWTEAGNVTIAGVPAPTKVDVSKAGTDQNTAQYVYIKEHYVETHFAQARAHKERVISEANDLKTVYGKAETAQAALHASKAEEPVIIKRGAAPEGEGKGLLELTQQAYSNFGDPMVKAEADREGWIKDAKSLWKAAEDAAAADQTLTTPEAKQQAALQQYKENYAGSTYATSCDTTVRNLDSQHEAVKPAGQAVTDTNAAAEKARTQAERHSTQEHRMTDQERAQFEREKAEVLAKLKR